MTSVIAFNVNGVDLSRSAKPQTSFRRFRSARIGIFTASLGLTVFAAFAADGPQPTVTFHPGETAHVIVTYKEPIALQGGMVRFGLQTPVPGDQKEFDVMMIATALKRVSDRSFEMDVKVGPHVATGTYKLNLINATTEQGLFRGFWPEKDFTPITIYVINDGKADFPGLQSVQLEDKDRPKP